MLQLRFRQDREQRRYNETTGPGGDVMVTPEKLARKACDDQEWKQIESAQLQNVPQHTFELRSTFLMAK
jgi:hypothetical protein